MADLALGLRRDRAEEGVDGSEAADAARVEVRGDVIPETLGVAGRGVVERLAICLSEGAALGFVEGTGIAEARADVGEIGACDDDGALYQAIVGGLSGTRTAEINRDIHSLGLVALEHGIDSEPFRSALDGFLARHGHRAPSREITDPRWRETPEVVIALVRAQLARTRDSKTPEALEREAAARRDAAEREALARVRNPIARRLLRALVAATRQLLEDTELRERLGAGALEMSHTFSWTHSQDSFAHVLSDVLAGQRVSVVDPDGP